MISILIPVKNEPYIQTLINRIHESLKKRYEIIVIDKSKFFTKVYGARLIRQKSDGLGNAILEGLKYAKGDVIVVMDGDGSHRPEDIKRLLEKINDYDIVIGSRFITGGITKDKAHRKTISLIFRRIASMALNLNIKDPMSGFAAFKKSLVNNLCLRPIGYKIIMEIIFKAKNCKVCEVPIVFERRKAGKPKGKIIEAIKTLIHIFVLKFRLV